MPTWTIAQNLYQVSKLEATPSVKNCVSQQDPQKFTTTATGAASSSGSTGSTGAAPSSGRPGAMRDPSNSGERKVDPQANTDGEQLHQEIDGPAKSFQPQNQEELEVYTMVLRSICAKFGTPWDPTDRSDFPLNMAIWSQFTNDCFCTSFQLSKDHEDFERMAIIKSFPDKCNH